MPPPLLVPVLSPQDPHSLDSSCPAIDGKLVSPCLADGSLSVVLDGVEALLAPGTATLGSGVVVDAVNLPGACRSFGFDEVRYASAALLRLWYLL